MKLKAFSIILKELSIARNYLRPESRTLKIPEWTYRETNDNKSLASILDDSQNNPSLIQIKEVTGNARFNYLIVMRNAQNNNWTSRNTVTCGNVKVHENFAK